MPEPDGFPATPATEKNSRPYPHTYPDPFPAYICAANPAWIG